MTTSLNGIAQEQDRVVIATQGLLLASTVGDAKYVSLKGYAQAEIWIAIADGTTITACDVTLAQATAVAGTNEKALNFDTVWKAVDLGASQTLVETAVTSNTFKTQTTNSKDSLYVINVTPDMLDIAGGFDCFRFDGANHAATSSRGCTVWYVLKGARYSGTNPLVD